MSENERAAFITSMVDRLAERLAATPDDFHGWMRLGQAYRVLGDREAALRAYERAAELARAPSFDPAARQAVGRAVPELRAPVPGRLTRSHRRPRSGHLIERQSVVPRKSVSVRVTLSGRRLSQQTTPHTDPPISHTPQPH